MGRIMYEDAGQRRGEVTVRGLSKSFTLNRSSLSVLRDLDLPRGALVAAVEKQGEVIKPRPDTRLEAGDLVLIFALSGDIAEVEQLLQISADWF